MTSVVLAFLEQAESVPPVLAGAETIAGMLRSSRINGLITRMPPIETILPSEEILTEDHIIGVRTREQHRADAIRLVFDEWAVTARSRGVATYLIDLESRPDTAVEDHGKRADVIVIKRPSRHEPDSERQAIHAALFATDRPVLIVPPEWTPMPFGRRVAIAWRDDGRTVKSVLATLRCLGQIEHIEVLIGLREDVPPPEMPAIFTEHAAPASLHVLPLPGQGAFGAALMAKAHALGCDMLVMGAYAHSPLRELLLGGVTRHMLARADLPVLMRH